MGELGFYAPNLDDYELPGLGETAYGVHMQELEACDSGLRHRDCCDCLPVVADPVSATYRNDSQPTLSQQSLSMASVQGSLVMYPIHAFGSDAQKGEWLPKLGRGEAVDCFGLTKPNHGSNSSAMETHAEPDGEGYVLNGTKTWITNSPIADVAVAWAKYRGDDTVRGFLVETDRDGVETPKIEEKLSLRASISRSRRRRPSLRVRRVRPP